MFTRFLQRKKSANSEREEHPADEAKEAKPFNAGALSIIPNERFPDDADATKRDQYESTDSSQTGVILTKGSEGASPSDVPPRKGYWDILSLFRSTNRET